MKNLIILGIVAFNAKTTHDCQSKCKGCEEKCKIFYYTYQYFLYDKENCPKSCDEPNINQKYYVHKKLLKFK